MSQVLIKLLAVFVLLIAGVSAFAQTGQTAKQAALDQRVRAEVRNAGGELDGRQPGAALDGATLRNSG
jgi:hypothetical protein